MQNVSATVEIEAPADKVWAVLADFGNIEAFNPGLTASYITGDSPSGVGATRHCDLSFAGASIEERISRPSAGSSGRDRSASSGSAAIGTPARSRSARGVGRSGRCRDEWRRGR